MKQMNISLKIRVIIVCLLPLYICGAEKDSVPKGLKVTNQCLKDIEISYSLPLPNEYTIKSPGGCQLILKGQKGRLPLETDLLCIKVGALHTNHYLVEDKINPLVIMESQKGYFIVYQDTKRHLLSLPKNEGFCLLH
jgi:hypothetical protein